MGGIKFNLRNVKYARRKKRESLKLIVAIPRNLISVLSEPIPVSISDVVVLSAELVPDSSSPVESLSVSLSTYFFMAGMVDSLNSLCTRLARTTLPTSWVAFNSDTSSVSISKLVSQGRGKEAIIGMSVVVDIDFKWCIHTLQRPLHVSMYSFLSSLPMLMNSVDSVFKILNYLDSTKFCVGNPDKDLVAVWYQQMLSLQRGCVGNCKQSRKH